MIFWPLGESNRVEVREHLEGALMLFAVERWQTYTADPERTYRALTAPGATTLVAMTKALWRGSYSSSLTAKSRLTFPLSALVREALARAGGLRIDLL
jgi:hypothetical protein